MNTVHPNYPMQIVKLFGWNTCSMTQRLSLVSALTKLTLVSDFVITIQNISFYGAILEIVFFFTVFKIQNELNSPSKHA